MNKNTLQLHRKLYEIYCNCSSHGSRLTITNNLKNLQNFSFYYVFLKRSFIEIFCQQFLCNCKLKQRLYFLCLSYNENFGSINRKFTVNRFTIPVNRCGSEKRNEMKFVVVIVFVIITLVTAGNKLPQDYYNQSVCAFHNGQYKTFPSIQALMKDIRLNGRCK